MTERTKLLVDISTVSDPILVNILPDQPHQPYNKTVLVTPKKWI
jgi:hypothetical protein